MESNGGGTRPVDMSLSQSSANSLSSTSTLPRHRRRRRLLGYLALCEAGSTGPGVSRWAATPTSVVLVLTVPVRLFGSTSGVVFSLSMGPSLFRYHSLCAYMGDDDMFSSDLSDDQLRMRLSHMSNTPCQVIYSMADEYMPEYVDKKALLERLCRAMGGAEKAVIEHGNHSLSNRIDEAVQAIINFVKREGPKGWDDP